MDSRTFMSRECLSVRFLVGWHPKSRTLLSITDKNYPLSDLWDVKTLKVWHLEGLTHLSIKGYIFDMKDKWRAVRLLGGWNPKSWTFGRSDTFVIIGYNFDMTDINDRLSDLLKSENQKVGQWEFLTLSTIILGLSIAMDKNVRL